METSDSEAFGGIGCPAVKVRLVLPAAALWRLRAAAKSSSRLNGAAELPARPDHPVPPEEAPRQAHADLETDPVMRPSTDRLRYLLGSSALALLAVVSLVAASCRMAYHAPRGPAPEGVRLDDGWSRSWQTWQPKTYPPIHVAKPQVANAHYVREDALCAVCHRVHVETFSDNVHRNHRCESCHGPASRHLESRGREPNSILSFKRMSRAERAEVCLTCHEQNACTPGAQWRTSTHAHHGVTCTDCHTNHYNVPPGTPVNTVDPSVSQEEFERKWTVVLARVRMAKEIRRLPASEPLPSLKGTSNHLGAQTPQICYGCHQEKQDLERIAHPHQVRGKYGFDCSTCHNPHGTLLAYARRDLCLECHQDTPTMSWHASIHDQVGVACTDCHNPHPKSHVQPVANISHTSVRRVPRLPMAVDEPGACVQCHTKMAAMMQLPSHHPMKEGKMTCSDCHDAHGQSNGNLKAETVNLTCYKCHADKQGPFVYQHAPVEEDCTICHNPHGTVANNLLHQPPAFLCLRCHSGHRAPPADHFGIGTSDIDGNTFQRPVLYTRCTQCHTQIHGTDHPSQNRPGALLR